MSDHVERIAGVLAGLPVLEKVRLVVDAFKHALVERPDLAEYEIDPRVVQLVSDIYRRAHEIEQEQGQCPLN